MREVECNTELTEYDKKRIAEDDSIIAVFHGKKGGTVYVRDTVLRTLSPEDMERNIKHMNDVANEIVRSYCRRVAAEKEKSTENCLCL